jgi:hypothetical protein
MVGVADPDSWRLRSPQGVVPFRYLGVEGTFEPEQASVQLKALIPANRLIEFCIETFPPAIQQGNISIPQSRILPGLPGLLARRLTFKSQQDGMPIDPLRV